MAYFSDVKARFPQLGELGWKNEVQIVNGAFAVISGHKGLAAVSDEKVRIRLKEGEVCLLGSGLKLVAVTEGEVYVSGNIAGVGYES